MTAKTRHIRINWRQRNNTVLLAIPALVAMWTLPVVAYRDGEAGFALFSASIAVSLTAVILDLWLEP